MYTPPRNYGTPPRYDTPPRQYGTPPRYGTPCSPTKSSSNKRHHDENVPSAPRKMGRSQLKLKAAIDDVKNSGLLPEYAEKINTGDGQSNKNAVFKDKEFIYKIASNEKIEKEYEAYQKLPEEPVPLDAKYNIMFPKAEEPIKIDGDYALLKLTLIKGLNVSNLIAHKLPECAADELIEKVIEFLEREKKIIYDAVHIGDDTEALGNMYLLDDNKTIVVIDFEFSKVIQGGKRRNNKKSTRKKKSLKTKLKRRSRRTLKKGGNKCDPTYRIGDRTSRNPYFEINPEELRNMQTRIHAEGDDIYYHNRNLTQDDVITELLNKYYNKDNFKDLVRDYINVDVDFSVRKCYDIRNSCNPFIIEMGPLSHMQTLNKFNREVIKQITIIIQNYKLPEKFYH